MTKPYALTAPGANLAAAKSCGESRRVLRSNDALMPVARRLFTVKTAQVLSDITGYSVRSCEYWLAGTAAIPGDAIVSLLHSEHGREFLAALMADAQPAWWRAVLSYFGILDAMRFQRTARRKLKAAIDADNDLTATIARAEAALSAQDENFYGAHFDAMRAAMRVPARSLAKTKGAKR